MAQISLQYYIDSMDMCLSAHGEPPQFLLQVFHCSRRTFYSIFANNAVISTDGHHIKNLMTCCIADRGLYREIPDGKFDSMSSRLNRF